VPADAARQAEQRARGVEENRASHFAPDDSAGVVFGRNGGIVSARIL
jgi:hypothetical protein